MEDNVLKDLGPYQIRRLMQYASAMGSIIALVRMGKLKPYLNKSEAFVQYGRANVEKWIEKGWVTSRKDGNHSAAWRLDRIELEAVERAGEFIRHLYHAS